MYLGVHAGGGPTGTHNAVVGFEAGGGASLLTDAVALRWNVPPPNAVPYTLRVEWLAADELPGFLRSQSALGRWNGAAYALAEPCSAAAGAGPYSRTLAGLTLPGSYIVGDQQAPLPVELIRFEARRPAGQPRAELRPRKRIAWALRFSGRTRAKPPSGVWALWRGRARPL